MDSEAMTDICEEPHATIEEEDDCEAQRAFVGKHVALRSLDGFEYEGDVTDSAYGHDGKEASELWLQLDGEWWVSVRHVTAAKWGEPDGS